MHYRRDRLLHLVAWSLRRIQEGGLLQLEVVLLLKASGITTQKHLEHSCLGAGCSAMLSGVCWLGLVLEVVLVPPWGVGSDYIRFVDLMISPASSLPKMICRHREDGIFACVSGGHSINGRLPLNTLW
jgi:hypothetical protein